MAGIQQRMAKHSVMKQRSMTTGSWQRAGAGVALVLALGLLAGCSGGSDPAGSSSAPTPSSASVSTSATPTTTAAAAPYKPADLNGPAQNVPKPVKPALADEFSEKGLDAFARYWYDIFNYMQETNDPTIVQTVTDQSCSRCNVYFAALIDNQAKGTWIMGGRMVVTTMQATFKPTPQGLYQVVIQYNVEGGQYVRQGGVPGDQIKAENANGDVLEAKFDNGVWRVANVGKIA
ncbi:DUF6318 family protein [Psychromicrobium xiongbiense]|uniref:DUF6318 family protein n=1 Tax=Psychromicrobium xiongbiense TaxID=3051184 RepID=UPI0025531D8D|nr:DUF6318 family protein [Psychromicrobium sp. YIM S02556]